MINKFIVIYNPFDPRWRNLMIDHIQQAREDISFLRDLAGDDGSVLRASAIGLIVAGGVFGLATLRSFALSSGSLSWPHALRPLMPWDAVVIFIVVLLSLLIGVGNKTRATRVIGSTSRTIWASWAAVGVGYVVAAFSLSMAGVHAGEIILFAFWGSGWFIASAAYRRSEFAVLALACYAVAIAAGLLSGTRYEDLLIGLALLTLVALPGLRVLKLARAVS